jgi:hypothetical protein
MIASCLGFFVGLGITPLSQAQTTCVSDAWTEVPGAGITNGSGPAAVVLNNDLHLFVTGGRDLVFTNVYQSASATWTGWSELPGNGITGGDGPAAVVYRNGLYIFVLDSTGLIYVNTRSPAGIWSGWSEVPGHGVGVAGLAAAVLSPIVRPDELELFVRGTDGAIYINKLAAGAWSGWTPVPGGGITTHGPAATAFGNVWLYVRGVGGGIFENFQALDTGAWAGWTEVPGAGYSTAAPGVAAGHINNHLVVRGLGSIIYQNLTGQGSPNQWTEVPGGGRAAATAGPAVVSYNGAYHVFLTGPGDRVFCSVLR